MFWRESGGLGNASPPDVYILFPGTYEQGSLHGKTDFVDLTELRILRWEIIQDYLGSSIIRLTHKSPYKEKSEAREPESEDM